MNTKHERIPLDISSENKDYTLIKLNKEENDSGCLLKVGVGFDLRPIGTLRQWFTWTYKEYEPVSTMIVFYFGEGEQYVYEVRPGDNEIYLGEPRSVGLVETHWIKNLKQQNLEEIWKYCIEMRDKNPGIGYGSGRAVLLTIPIIGKRIESLFRSRSWLNPEVVVDVIKNNKLIELIDETPEVDNLYRMFLGGDWGGLGIKDSFYKGKNGSILP